VTNHLPPLGEFGRIERFFRPLAAGFPGALNLTDDAATIPVPAGKELVVTTDAIVAGVHFLPDDPPADIARKALRVNLSDLAAKGATPLAYTLTLATGAGEDDRWVEAFADGLASDQTQYGIALAGGDSVSTPGPVWVSITAFGLADAGRTVRRNGAKPGDVVMVTGTIGDAAFGLAVLQGNLAVPEADRVALVDRYRLPRPRTALAEAIGQFAHASVDVSDGLAADFGHLCRASNVQGTILADKVPLSPEAGRVLAADPGRLSDVLGGGDDYEVLLTVPPDRTAALAAVAESAGVVFTEIGHIAAASRDPGAIVLNADGSPTALPRPGWTHV
jgi:thiamine-monophosphate kinase